MRRLSPAFMVATALFAVSLLAGTLIDRPAPHRVEQRGDWLVLEGDFHVHTRFSDGFLSPFEVVVQARRRGLDVIAVTDHNNLFPARWARWLSERVGGPTVLLGEEITTRRFHVHGIGLTETVGWDQPLAAVIEDIHRQGGLAVAAHPVKRYWSEFEAVLDRLDGAEVMHPTAYNRSGRGSFRWEDMRTFYLRALESGVRLTAIGSSDYHFFSPLGVCRTLVFAQSDAPEHVMEALRAGRTVVTDLEGRHYGDPEMIALLEAEPYAPREQDFGYRGEGPADRFTRTLGWFGLVGMIVFRRRRAEESAD